MSHTFSQNGRGTSSARHLLSWANTRLAKEVTTFLGTEILDQQSAMYGGASFCHKDLDCSQSLKYV